MGFQLLKFLDDVSNQAIFIVGNIHHIKEFPQQLLHRFHLDGSHCLSDGDAGFADLILLPQHIRQLGIVRLDGRTAIFDGYLLLVDEQRHHGGDVNFPPAVGNPLIPTLHIVHGGGQFGAILHHQKFLDLGSGIAVRLRAGQEIPGQEFHNILIRVHIFCNQVQLTVNMGDQIVQRLVDTGFGVAAANLNVLAVHIVRRVDNGLLQILHGRLLIAGSLFLLVTDDVLHGLGQLGHVPLFYELPDLHGVFQRFIVGGTRKHHNGLAVRFCH